MLAGRMRTYSFLSVHFFSIFSLTFHFFSHKERALLHLFPPIGVIMKRTIIACLVLIVTLALALILILRSRVHKPLSSENKSTIYNQGSTRLVSFNGANTGWRSPIENADPL